LSTSKLQSFNRYLGEVLCIMPGTGPTWLTGWVKLNSKHMSHVSSSSKVCSDDEEKCQQTATTARSPQSEMSPKAGRRNWSRKSAKDKSTTIVEESRALDVQLQRNISDHHRSHQILSEAAFMTPEDTSEPTPSQLRSDDVYPIVSSRSSPEGLIVTTIAAKPRPTVQDLSSTNHLNRLAAIFTGEREPCQSCISLEKKLDEVYDDLEYMRSVALQQQQEQASSAALQHHTVNECSVCGSHKPYAADAAHELRELVQRHKQVVEALVSERVSVNSLRRRTWN
jgi:hypothetical protein